MDLRNKNNIIIRDANKVFENDIIIYTPIHICEYFWSIDCSKNSSDLQKDLRKETKKGNKIIALVVYKDSGEYSFVQEGDDDEDEGHEVEEWDPAADDDGSSLYCDNDDDDE